MLILSLLFSSFIYANCLEVHEDDNEMTIIEKQRDCRIYKSHLSQNEKSEENDKKIKEVSDILKKQNRNFSHDTDRGIAKNLNLMIKNKKIIDKNEKLLKAVDKDLATLEGKHANFTAYQKDVNKLNALAIGQNLEDVAIIFKDLARKNKEIQKNQLEIETNKIQIEKNMASLIDMLADESSKRKDEIKALEEKLNSKDDQLEAAINEKLGNVCDSIKYCGAANADLKSARRGSMVDYDSTPHVSNSTRHSASFTREYNSNIGQRRGSTVISK